jgi:hypothetical protein
MRTVWQAHRESSGASHQPNAVNVGTVPVSALLPAGAGQAQRPLRPRDMEHQAARDARPKLLPGATLVASLTTAGTTVEQRRI